MAVIAVALPAFGQEPITNRLLRVAPLAPGATPAVSTFEEERSTSRDEYAASREAMVRNQIAAGRWVALSPTVIGTTTGPLSREQLQWLGVLHAGPAAVLGDLRTLFKALDIAFAFGAAVTNSAPGTKIDDVAEVGF